MKRPAELRRRPTGRSADEPTTDRHRWMPLDAAALAGMEPGPERPAPGGGDRLAHRPSRGDPGADRRPLPRLGPALEGAPPPQPYDRGPQPHRARAAHPRPGDA